ncbi:FtsX-like permease family protein [Segetibacter sp. 3557_3]|uniref:ABC transporter permease n=1 Tax=Segetibacter sp. 3557_3 TaxID=2547429 RepID=UPI001059215A|nr:ABC transporter permease [Segetibacter sp. 3557_3]TDH21651.1 FtsX-like permease family protein [Segetibacter sp. 3557_3]
MLSHLFKLIWNKKKQNFLLLMEMFVSFLVMFAVFTLLVYYYKNFKVPHGFQYENVWAVNYNDAVKPDRLDSVALYMQTVRQTLLGVDGVQDITFTSANIPFSFTQNNNFVSYNKNKVLANVYEAEDNYASLFNLSVISGRWFDKTDIAGQTNTIVINNRLKESLFGNDEAIGKTILAGDEKLRVIGVSNDMKIDGDYQPTENGFFRKLDTAGLKYNSTILVKIRPGIDASFEPKLFKVLNNVIRNANIEIEHFTKKRERKNTLSLVPMILLSVVGGFLIINVALGLFGVLWYNINKRRCEIGLRRAVGASGSAISWQLIGEALVLSTLAIILGSFFAVQFPLLNVFDLPAGVYLTAIALAIAFIYGLVMICALYPGKQAAAIYPAVALHEE